MCVYVCIKLTYINVDTAVAGSSFRTTDLGTAPYP
jgi:hypothetical protein